MLSKGKIISDTLKLLGNVQSYNDTSSNEYNIASSWFETILTELSDLDNMNSHQVTIKLNYYDSVEPDKYTLEYKYNKPNNMKNHISPTNLRYEGEFIYSTQKDLKITYIRTLALEEIPDNHAKLFRYRLARELCSTFPKYRQRLGEFSGKAENELKKLQSSEFDGQYNYLEDVENSTWGGVYSNDITKKY